MATLYLKTAGGNWTDAGAWSNASAGGVDNSGPPTAADDCIAELLSGNVTISAASVGKSFSAIAGTGNWGGNLTHNAFTLTISGSVTFSSTMTYIPLSTSTLVMNATSTLHTDGEIMSNITANSGVLTLDDDIFFLAAKTIVFTLAGTSVNQNGKSINGNSATNRVLVRSSTLGTGATLTVASGTFSSADFRDIAFSSAVSLDLSAITGLSGDCGGNTITGGGATLTFTTPATQTYTGGTDNWSTAARWTSRVPLPQDDALMIGVTGGTITADMPRLGKSIDWTGAAGSPTWAVSAASGVTIYGSINMTSLGTMTQTTTVFLEGRGSFTYTSAGKTGAGTTVQMIGGTMTLGDAFLNTGQFSLNNGTFSAANFNVTIASFTSNVTTTRAYVLGAGVWTVTGSGIIWRHDSSTGLTVTSTGSTVFISDTGASSKTFSLANGTVLNDLKIAGGGSGAVILAAAATYNRIYTDGGGTKTITLPGSTTTTILSGEGLGNGINIITFNASAGSATISSAVNTVSWASVSLTNIPSAGGASFYAGATPPSVDGGGNTGWIFTAPPPIPQGGISTILQTQGWI